MTDRDIRVLVVEDDPDVRRDLAEVLVEEGYTVEVAAHGAEALERARLAQPDIVLLDLNLPVMDGWAFYEALLGLEGGGRSRIIVMSVDRHAETQARRLGAIGCLTKPFDLNELLARVSATADQISTECRTRAETP